MTQDNPDEPGLAPALWVPGLLVAVAALLALFGVAPV